MAFSWPVEWGFLTFFDFLCAFLVCIPLFWHLQSWNIGCLLFIFWAAILNLTNGINHVVWRNNAINWAPVYCDIVIRLQYAGHVGLVAAGLVIARRISKIATATSVSSTWRDKRNVILVDLAIGMFFPMAQFVIFFFVQGHRFDIYEGWGCFSAVPNTIMHYFLYNMWEILIGCGSIYYCTITLRAFMKRRKQFSELLASNSNLTYNRYFRLMAMAMVEICCTVPLGIFITVAQATWFPIYEWKGFADLHSGFSRVRQFPQEFWLDDYHTKLTLEMQDWLIIATTLIFFSFFGLGEEAVKHYRSAYTFVAKSVGLSTGSVESSTGFTTSKGSKLTSSGFGKISIPTFIQRNASKCDSIASSFTDRLSTAISVGDFPDFDSEKLNIPYPSSESSNSSSCLPSPADEKTGAEAEVKGLPLPPARPDSGVEIEVRTEVEVHRPSSPDVPSAIHGSDNNV